MGIPRGSGERGSLIRFWWYRVSTHLHDLAIDGKGEEVRDVLSTPAGRASIDARDGYGFTALHLAADRGEQNTFVLILI